MLLFPCATTDQPCIVLSFAIVVTVMEPIGAIQLTSATSVLPIGILFFPFSYEASILSFKSYSLELNWLAYLYSSSVYSTKGLSIILSSIIISIAGTERKSAYALTTLISTFVPVISAAPLATSDTLSISSLTYDAFGARNAYKSVALCGTIFGALPPALRYA